MNININNVNDAPEISLTGFSDNYYADWQLDENNTDIISSLTYANWDYSTNTAESTRNSGPSVFYSDFTMDTKNTYTGSITINPATDDDMVGFVLGYTEDDINNSDGFMLIDWKKAFQNHPQMGDSAAGLRASFVNAQNISNNDIWQRDPLGSNVLANNLGNSAYSQQDYTFDFVYNEDSLKIYVDSVLEFDLSPSDFGINAFPSGSLGYYTFTQIDSGIRPSFTLNSLSGPDLLTSMNEDTTTNGNSISEIVSTSIYDVDVNSEVGIAITAIDNSNGSWQYNTGASWQNIGAVAEGNALHLDADDRLRFVPDTDYVGSATIDFRAWDTTTGASGSYLNIAATGGTTAYSSSSSSASIEVTQVNDAPSFDNGSDINIAEDASAQTFNAFTTSMFEGHINESDQSLNFTVSTSDNDAFEIFPSVDADTGNFTFKMAQNFNGTVAVSLTLHDDGGTENGGVDSITKTFNINVSPVNDAPSFAIGSDITLYESSSLQTIDNFSAAMLEGHTNESDQNLSFTTTTSNDSAFRILPTVDAQTGNLSFALSEGFNGSILVNLTLNDDGGTENGGVDSVTKSFNINVNPVNSTPNFTVGSDINLTEDDTAQTFNAFTTSMFAGHANESSQNLNFSVTTSNDSAFEVLPAVDANTGDLTFAMAENFNGTVTVNLTLNDDGGTENGGTDSITKSFNINVASVADTPTLFVGDVEGTQTNKGIPLNISAAAGATNEVLTLLIEGLPEGTVVSGGTKMASSWLVDGVNIDNLTANVPIEWFGTRTITVTAISTDDSSVATFSKQFELNVIPFVIPIQSSENTTQIGNAVENIQEQNASNFEIVDADQKNSFILGDPKSENLSSIEVSSQTLQVIASIFHMDFKKADSSNPYLDKMKKTNNQNIYDLSQLPEQDQQFIKDLIQQHTDQEKEEEETDLEDDLSFHFEEQIDENFEEKKEKKKKHLTQFDLDNAITLEETLFGDFDCFEQTHANLERSS
ncbi:MAG: hypothetical protein NE334_06190 [Lentisphaeraceae bacterium]|nr:hypothetical protein [Lentisphaeraceae bacterium]